MIVIQNFLDNVDEVLDFAETTKYFDTTHFPGTGFNGTRTENLCEIFPNIVNKIHIETGHKPDRLYIHKHFNEKTPPIRHFDNAKKGGVIFLKGGEGCGTIVDNQLYEYEFNKLIMYDSHLFHSPEGFPEDRLVMTFFVFKDDSNS